jgi:hypothetical protein
MRRSLHALMLAVVVLVAPAAIARPCTADSQCLRGFAPEARCSGDTLVVYRSQCIAGQCQTREERRETCRRVERSGCIAGAFERTGRRCDATLARCVTRTDRDLCAKGCACKDKVLHISTGQCTANLGCTRLTLRCEHGCACSPEPKCLDPK